MSAEWVPQVGDRVVEFRGGMTVSISKVLTITKIGKRDVVLSNGDRFNVNTLHKSGKSSSWSRTILKSADDPIVAEVRQSNLRRTRYHHLLNAVESIRNTRAYTAADLDAIQESLDACREVIA